MALVLTAPPAAEPLTVAEAKAHLRIGHAEEDAMVASLITTSRLHVEAALGLALIDQDWSYTLDSWPDGHVLLLPLRPVRAVTGVRVTTSDGSIDTLPADRYLLDGAALPPRLHAMGGAWPRPGRRALGIEVAFTAGFGATAASVPPPVRQALLMLVAHWYEHREPVLAEGAPARVPDTVSALLLPYRTVRL
jgi:uncharacterized phiE125 gp8 family phage protein